MDKLQEEFKVIQNVDYASFSEVDENGNFVDVCGYYEDNNIDEMLKEMQEMEKNEKIDKEA